MNSNEETSGRDSHHPQSRNFDAVFDAIYVDLHRRAAQLRRLNPNMTMVTTEIVNQTYVNLRPARELRWSEIPHFKSIVVQAMRHLMVDLARKRRADKRGGKDAVRVPMEEVDVADRQSAEYVLDLNRMLDELARIDERQATMLEMKYFGGLGNLEIAEELDVSTSTVLRDLRAAEAWLRKRLPPPASK